MSAYKDAAWWKAYRAERARLGLCYSCREPRTHGIYCKRHKKYFRAHDARMRAARKDAALRGAP